MLFYQYGMDLLSICQNEWIPYQQLNKLFLAVDSGLDSYKPVLKNHYHTVLTNHILWKHTTDWYQTLYQVVVYYENTCSWQISGFIGLIRIYVYIWAIYTQQMNRGSNWHRRWMYYVYRMFIQWFKHPANDLKFKQMEMYAISGIVMKFHWKVIKKDVPCFW